MNINLASPLTHIFQNAEEGIKQRKTTQPFHIIGKGNIPGTKPRKKSFQKLSVTNQIKSNQILYYLKRELKSRDKSKRHKIKA
jgi:hypothetical protein